MNLNIKGSSRGQPLKIFPTVKHNDLKKADDDDDDDEVNVKKYHSFEFFGKKETLWNIIRHLSTYWNEGT